MEFDSSNIPYQEAGYIIAFEELMDKLAIIVPDIKQKSDWERTEYLPIENRLDYLHQREGLFDFKTLQPFRDKLKEVQLQNTTSVCEKLCQLLKSTINDLQQDGTFESIKNEVEVHKNLKNDEQLLLDKTECNVSNIPYLKNQLHDEIIHSESKNDNLMLLIGDLQNSLQETIKSNRLKANYIQKWGKAQIYQESLRHKIKEDNLIGEIEKYFIKMKQEERITRDIEAYLREVILNLLSNIKMWMDKYNTDLKVIELKIQKLKMNRDAQIELLTSLDEEYVRKQNEIKEYKLMAIQKVEAEKLLKSQIQSAIKIQAWWRGVMIRRKLCLLRKKKNRTVKKNNKKF